MNNLDNNVKTPQKSTSKRVRLTKLEVPKIKQSKDKFVHLPKEIFEAMEETDRVYKVTVKQNKETILIQLV